MTSLDKSPDILVVDDDLQNLKLLIALLDKKGYLARPVNNGRLALRVIQAAPPDLILLDINMPETDGYDVCKKLKEDPITRDIPVIFISVHQNINAKLKAFQTGGADYITKPFSAEEVFARIEKHLTINLLEKQLKEQNERLFKEIAERKKIEAELRKLAQAVNCSGSPITISDLDGKIEFVNAAFSEFTGYAANEIIGQPSDILESGKTEAHVYKELWDTLKKGKVWRGELLNRKKSGELYWDQTIIAPITNQKGQPTHYVAVRDDITKRKEEIERLAYIATHDILTGLPNRLHFDDRINHALTLAKRYDWQVAIFFIDLNHFKAINDRLGHAVGDDALLEFGKRLRASVRESDTVARLGGDEFVYLVEKIPNEEYLPLIAKKIIRTMERPFEVGKEHIIYLTASIGISVYPQDGDNSATLLENADKAMYKAKKIIGQSCYRFYNSTVNTQMLSEKQLPR